MADHGVMTEHVNMLVWGGPEHGKVVTAEATVGSWLFVVPPCPLRAVSYKPDPEPTMHALGTVRYDRERVRNNYGDEWFVLVYPENKERHQERLTDVLNGLARMCTLRWMLDGEDE